MRVNFLKLLLLCCCFSSLAFAQSSLAEDRIIIPDNAKIHRDKVEIKKHIESIKNIKRTIASDRTFGNQKKLESDLKMLRQERAKKRAAKDRLYKDVGDLQKTTLPGMNSPSGTK